MRYTTMSLRLSKAMQPAHAAVYSMPDISVLGQEDTP